MNAALPKPANKLASSLTMLGDSLRVIYKLLQWTLFGEAVVLMTEVVSNCPLKLWPVFTGLQGTSYLPLREPEITPVLRTSAEVVYIQFGYG